MNRPHRELDAGGSCIMPRMAPPLRCAVYTRLSKDTEASTSIERQRRACRKLARERGWQVVLEADDVDVSATRQRLDRPGLDRIRAEYDNLDAVVFWKVDRLARSIVDFAALMDEAERHGVALVSATEPVDLSTPMGRAMAGIVAIFAELEARTIGVRMASTIAHLRRIGKEPGGRMPYGWRRMRDAEQGWRAELHPDEAPVLREAALRVTAGEPMLTIARDFTARCIPTPRGGEHWNPTTLHRALRNPTLLGHTLHRGEVVRDEDGLPLVARPPLLSADEWAALQAVLDTRARPTGRAHADALLLAGVAVCGRCGSRLYAARRAGRTYYQCGAKGQGKPCPGVSISQARLDAFVTDALLTEVGDYRETRTLPRVEPTIDAEAVRAALDDLERDRYERGLFAGDEGAARFASMHARLSERLAEAEAAPEAERVVETGRTIADAWAEGDGYLRRALVAAFVDEVVVSAGRRGGGQNAGERARIGWRG